MRIENLHALRCLTMFVGSLAVVALSLRALLPMPDVPEVRDKLEWLATHGSAYDTIFIGSSRVRHQIAPAIVDARKVETSIVVRSYNLGIDAMTFPKIAYVLDRILQKKPSKLRLVVADLNALRPKLGPGNSAESLSTVYWHDFRHTAQVCEAVWRDAANGSRPWS